MSNDITSTFIKHKGKTYMLTSPPISAWEDTAKYLRNLYMQEANDQLKGLEVRVAIELAKFNKAESDKIKPVTEQFLEAVQRPTGFCYFAYHIIRINNPKVTLEEVTDVMTDGTPEQYAEKVTAIFAAAGFNPPNPTTPTVATKE